ncbi:MAG: hypothetical protein NTW86_25585 [Candidatus Sumerlaeota bacterium]|nr:hypothetical protein [Candidatus Sumerlaeota bacterium]
MNPLKRLLQSGMRVALPFALAFLFAAPREARGHTPTFSVSIRLFYDSLAPYGTWVDDATYGRCWIPGGVAAGWRPYTQGYWAYTDYGWTWVSDEPWGWAAFHYGWWVYDPYWGAWKWIPGTVWAPAWVVFRANDDHIGWAPCPPRYYVSAAYVDYDDPYFVDWNAWVFVPRRHFCDHHASGYYVSPARNSAFLHDTHNVTSFERHGDRLINRSFGAREIEEAAGRRVEQLRVEDREGPTPDMVKGDRLRMFRPVMAERVSGDEAAVKALTMPPRPVPWAEGGRSPDLRGKGIGDRESGAQVKPGWDSMDELRSSRGIPRDILQTVPSGETGRISSDSRERGKPVLRLEMNPAPQSTGETRGTFQFDDRYGPRAPFATPSAGVPKDALRTVRPPAPISGFSVVDPIRTPTAKPEGRSWTPPSPATLSGRTSRSDSHGPGAVPTPLALRGGAPVFSGAAREGMPRPPSAGDRGGPTGYVQRGPNGTPVPTAPPGSGR